jgi:transcription initiation factor TFIIIB Brf1 subunit/transcription initiation factor TFIIB
MISAAAAVHTAATKEHERRTQEEVGLVATCSSVALRHCAAVRFGAKPRRGRPSA